MPPAGFPPAVPAPSGGSLTEASLTNTAADPNRAASVPTRDDPRAAGGRRPTARPGGADVDLETLLASATAPQASTNVVSIGADEHPGADDAALFAVASAPAVEKAVGDLRLLDPGQKEVARHVEQTQMLLRSIKNARADRGGAADVAYEKGLSRKLLAENATLQLEADVKGDKGTRQVLDTIEPFLLDIANMRENPSRDEVRSIRERVRKNEIVAALQVY